MTAESIPEVEAVAAFLRGCASLALPFKATAGLHQPLRHFAPELGAEQHGFLNLLAATSLSLADADAPEIEAALGATDRAGLDVHEMDLTDARRLFTGFGTCSIAEPIEGLERLGLLDG